MAGTQPRGWPGFFRVFAVFGAIVLILAQAGQVLVSPNSTEMQILMVYEGVTRWAIPALFLLWGMQALEEHQTLSSSLTGLVLPTFVRLVFWGILYAVVSHLLGGGVPSWGGILHSVEQAVRGNSYFHLWLLYPLLGLYLLHPLLQAFTASATKGEVLYVLGLCFLFASLLPLAAAFYPTHILVVFLQQLQVPLLLGFVGYYLAGWYLGHYVISRLSEFLIYLLGIVGMILTLAGSSLFGGDTALWYSYTSPNVAFSAVAFCVLFRYVLGISEERSRRGAVQSLGSCMFGVYLIHQIWVLVFGWFDISPLALGALASIPCFALIYTLLSFPFAWLLSRIPGVGRFLIQ